MAAGAAREAREATGEPTLTPLIDITFLVLIFFLVAVKMRATEGRIDAFLPRDRGLGPTPIGPIVPDPRIALRWVDPATGHETRAEHGRARLYLDRLALPDRAAAEPCGRCAGTHPAPDFGALARRLEAQRRAGGGRAPGGPPAVTLDARPAVPWRYVVSALDACLRAGVRDVTFAGAAGPEQDGPGAAGPWRPTPAPRASAAHPEPPARGRGR